MKLNTLKHCLSVIVALTLFTTVSMAQASEETENIKTEDTQVTTNNVADSTKADVKNTETVSTQVASDDVHMETTVEEDNNTTDYTDNNTFGNVNEAIVSDQKPIVVFPNPMVTSATIRFYNPDKAPVTLDIYDNTGRVIVHVGNLYDNEYNIDKDVIPQGIYYARIKKKNSDDDDDDDEDAGMTGKNSNGSDVQVYTIKFVVN